MKHTHHFIESYDELVGFGFNRETDEKTICYYLQKFSDDALMENLLKKLSGQELQELFDVMTRLLKKHLSDAEYHRLFLKDGQKRDPGVRGRGSGAKKELIRNKNAEQGVKAGRPGNRKKRDQGSGIRDRGGRGSDE